MKHIFGVTNNSILQVQEHLRAFFKEEGVKGKIQSLGLSDEPLKKADVILVATVSHFLRKLPLIERTKAVVFVFDSPILCEYIKPITLLDVMAKKQSYVYNFKPLESVTFAAAMREALDGGKVKVERKSIDVIPTMLGEQLSTVLNPVQDFLYGVRDTDKRLHFQKAIYTWLVSGSSAAVLKKRLIELQGIKAGAKLPVAMTRLIAELETDTFVRSKAAFKEAFAGNIEEEEGTKKKAVNYKKLGKKHGVDTFDIRYTMKAIRKFGSFQDVAKDVRQIYKETTTAAKTRKELEEAEADV